MWGHRDPVGPTQPPRTPTRSKSKGPGWTVLSGALRSTPGGFVRPPEPRAHQALSGDMCPKEEAPPGTSATRATPRRLGAASGCLLLPPHSRFLQQCRITEPLSGFSLGGGNWSFLRVPPSFFFKTARLLPGSHPLCPAVLFEQRQQMPFRLWVRESDMHLQPVRQLAAVLVHGAWVSYVLGFEQWSVP